jgi:hypothetical protein
VVALAPYALVALVILSGLGLVEGAQWLGARLP